MNDLIVYKEWPTSVVADALREFNNQMHDGAGIAELSAGLHGLDFLTRRSVLSADLQARVDGAVTEARMRIQLLAEKEASERCAEEQHRQLIKAATALHRQITSFHRRFIDPGRFDAEEVRELVQQLIARRMQTPKGGD